MLERAAPTVVSPDPDWVIGKHALLNLHAVRRRGRTEIDPRSWRIPYQWQGCHYQDTDDQPYLLLINSAGGFVEGDVAELHAHLDPQTRALITTTAASKFYKCLEGQLSRDHVQIEVGDGAVLEYYPDEAIPFARSRVHRHTRISLTSTSSLFATDMLSAGRVAFGAGESFAFSSLFSEFEVLVDGERKFIDRFSATDAKHIGALRRLWGGAKHMATVVAYTPDLPALATDEVHAALQDLPGLRAGVTRIDGMAVCRFLSDETWQCHDAIYRSWTALRPHIAGKPARPIRKC
jgi:urease accessory protein